MFQELPNESLAQLLGQKVQYTLTRTTVPDYVKKYKFRHISDGQMIADLCVEETMDKEDEGALLGVEELEGMI